MTQQTQTQQQTQQRKEEAMAQVQIRNLYDELLQAVKEHDPRRAQDFRFGSWVKAVTSVDRQGSDGYAFKGEFIPRGTIEVKAKPAVYLVMTTNGSRKYTVNHYSVVQMSADGQLTVTDIYTTNQERGWALRIRDRVWRLLSEMADQERSQERSPLADFSDDALIAELERRGYVVSRRTA